MTQVQHKTRYSRAYDLDVAGRTLAIAGSAALAGGIAWLLIDAYAGPGDDGTAGLGLHFAPGPGGLSVGGAF